MKPPASSPPKQPELDLYPERKESRLWTVRFTYHKYVRWRGVLVDQQVRAERKFPATSDRDAARACRDWVLDQLVREFDSYQRNVANIQEGQSLTRHKSVTIQNIL